MIRHPRPARLLVGSTVVAAALGAGVAASSAAASTPPTPPPPDSAVPPPTIATDREGLVDTIVSTSAEGGLPMNRECVASLVAEVPDEDVATIIGEIEMAATATAVEIPDISLPDLDDISIPELPEFSIPDLGDISIPELPEFSIPDLGDVSIPELPELSIPDLPDVSIPIPDVSLSPATLALSRDLVDCVEGDADPALVDEVVTLAQETAPEGMLDLDCARRILSTFPDEVLQQIADNGAVQADPTSVDPAIAAEVVKLLACTSFPSMGGSADATAAPAPSPTEPVTSAG